jgi:hypothetical protein
MAAPPELVSVVDDVEFFMSDGKISVPEESLPTPGHSTAVVSK